MDNSIYLPTEHGDFKAFYHKVDNQECLVIINDDFEGIPFLRIHSSCVFSESFHASDCDCAIQLDAALKYIGEQGGIVIYMYQEGRGIGIEQKIMSLKLEQEKGMDTATAFKSLGHDSDPRHYNAAVSVLKYLGVDEVKLGTNNKKKISILERSGISISERIKLEIFPNERTQAYIAKKVVVLDHYEND